MERTKANGAFANTTMKQDSPHSVLLMDAFNPPTNADIHGKSCEKYVSIYFRILRIKK